MKDSDRVESSPTDLEDELDAAVRGDKEPAPPGSSLIDDLTALADDGKTLFEAEIGFQKTRLAFAANRSKSAVLSGLMAIGFLHLALIALVVGAVIALTPYLTAFGATAAVVGILLAGAFLLLLRVRGSAREIGEAFENDADQNDD
ncbi:MAG: phage holin family protein [Altererythrobacter sp.]|uniref:phage holin family protein n=1 Tax=uncultured Altererythrobacter sp. TaxID=500840 RepID=UPI0017A123C7|nr:phage holin family protein [uncultured Altererythrobacter sp.]MBT8431187.1 phage holin family protein [Altererythrobacter sp.]NNK45988.1 phage holin family protein [Altererythrobacter sp.]